MPLLRPILTVLYAVYVWIVGIIMLPPLWILSISLPGSTAVRRRCATLSMRLIAVFIGLRIKVEGLENLPEGPTIVVTNHVSYMDGPMMLLALPPRISFVVKSEASRVPVIAMMLRRMGCTFVSRDNAVQGSADMRRLMRSLRAGQSLGLFPEGHIQRKPGLQQFRLGAFLIAARCGVPVVPAAIRGTRQFLPRNRLWISFSSFHIKLLPPIHPQGEDRKAAELLRDQAYAAVLAHCEEDAASVTLHQDPDAASP